MDEQLQNEFLFGEEGEHHQTYTKLSEKYEDVKSSAITLLFVGIAGIVAMILIYLKVIPLPINGTTTWLFDIVMGGLFIAFIIAGFVSLSKAGNLKTEAEAEDELISDILDWSKKNINKDALEQDLDLTQPEEILYFSRFDRIKDLLMHEFETADEALIDELSETVYQNIYENDAE